MPTLMRAPASARRFSTAPKSCAASRGSRAPAAQLPPAQLHALAYLPGDLSTIDDSIYGVFYGFDIACVAYLVFKSTFLPRAIGVLLAIDTLGYLVSGFTDFLAPGVAAHLVPWIGLPTIAGEGSLCLWLLLVGVDVERWKERASAAIPMCSLFGQLARDGTVERSHAR